LQKLLFFIRDWNTSARKSEIAQTALNVVLRTINADRLLELPKLKEIMDGLLPYTERHFNRCKKMLIDHYIIDLVVDDVKK
jgi:U3 small nucleolar RNA-associated protein 13